MRITARRWPAHGGHVVESINQASPTLIVVPDFDVSGKPAETKMAFNFAHLLSAACGDAARRLRALRALFLSLFL